MTPGLQKVLTAGCRSAAIAEPVFEVQFHPTRRWRFDAAWMDEKVALEIEGALFAPGGGRHNRGAGQRGDIEKYAEAAVHGWRLIRCMPEDITNGRALAWIQRALAEAT